MPFTPGGVPQPTGFGPPQPQSPPAVFADLRLDILLGLVSNKGEATGWNALVRSIPVTAVVRTSSTVVTITLPALPSYDITALETLTVTVPQMAILGYPAFVATPTVPIMATPVVRPGTGSLTLAGFAPSFPLIVQPGLGVLDLTGFGPTVGLPVTVQPGVGALSLAGFVPTIGVPLTLTPGVGALTLAGFAPTIGLPLTVRPDFGALTLTGFAPAFPTIVQPGVGALTLAGLAPTLGLPLTVQPGVGALTLAGFAPTIVTASSGPVTVAPVNPGKLILTGRSPTIRPTAPAFDAAVEVERLDTSNPVSWTHTPVGTPRVIVVSVVHGTSSTDHVTGVTYGGVALTRKIRTTDEITEPGASELWFLGAGIPTGPQTVTATLASATTDDIHFVSQSFTAGRDCEVIATGHRENNQPNPSVTLQYGSRNALAVAALYGGGSTPANLTPNANCTLVHDFDMGAFYSAVIRQTAQSTGDFAIGGTDPGDDMAYTALAFAEIQTFADLRQDIIDALTADGIEPRGWNNEVRDKIPPGSVVRTSSTRVTITLPAVPAYNISDVTETITVTIPATVITLGAPLAAPPPFTVSLLVAVGPTVTPGVGALVLAGFEPTIDTPSVVRPGVGALTLAGLAPAVVVGVTVLPGVGQLTLTGLAPTVVMGAGPIVRPGVGGLTLAGFAPVLSAGSVNYFFANYFQAQYFGARHFRRGPPIPSGFDDFRQAIINGIVSAQSETRGWNVKRSLIPPSAVVRTSDTVVTITLPALSSYNIATLEILTVTVPGTVTVAGTPLVANPTLTIDELPAPLLVEPATGQLDLVGYAPTIVTVSPFNAVRGQLIFGIVSAESEVAGWNALRDQIPETAVVRTSGTVVTVTLPPLPGYDITATEHLTVIVPDEMVTAGLVITASPTIQFRSFGVSVAPATGQLDLAGLAPTVGALPGATVAPPTGQLVLTGLAPTAGTSMNPGTGALVLTGLPATLGTPLTVQPGAGGLDLAGVNPIISTAPTVNVSPSVGALTLAGFASTIGTPATTRPATGLLTLTGFGVTLTGVVSEVFDPYAWFPTPVLPFGGVRRLEDLTDERLRKRKKHRHPMRVPRAKRSPIMPVPLVEPPPEATGTPFGDLPPGVPQTPQEALQAPIAAGVAPDAVPQPEGAHWSAYAHIPYSAADEAEELQAILAAVLGKGAKG